MRDQVWSGNSCKINPARSWIKIFMKGCLKIASIVLHTRLVHLMKLGVCVQRTITDLSSLIHKCVQEQKDKTFCSGVHRFGSSWAYVLSSCRTRTVLQSFVLGLFQIMITNTLVRCQFNMYLQWEFHIVLCYVFSSIKSTLVCLNVIKTP